jgi:hypothetical protein
VSRLDRRDAATADIITELGNDRVLAAIYVSKARVSQFHLNLRHCPQFAPQGRIGTVLYASRLKMVFLVVPFLLWRRAAERVVSEYEIDQW